VPGEPTTADTLVGASGTLQILAELELAEDNPVPIRFLATTVNVYVVLDVNPVTVIGEPDPVAVIPPGDDVTV
jgi:hypothetical protein